MFRRQATRVQGATYRRGLILALSYNLIVAWEVEVTDEFKVWWDGLSEDEQLSVGPIVVLLSEHGPALTFPHSSKVSRSRHKAMRELRIQHQGRPYRILYMFDPRRMAILLLGGDKTGDDRWYDKNVPLADRIYDDYLTEIKEQDGAEDDEME